MKITLAGNMILDVINEINAFPNRGMLTNISDVSYAVGGSPSNTGITLKRLDKNLDISFIGRIGNDDYGKYILNIYKNEGIDTSSIIIDSTKKTSFTQVMSEKGKERTFFYFGGASDNFSFEDIKNVNLESDIFHLGYALLLPKFENENNEYINDFAKTFALMQEKGAKTSLDCVSATKGKFIKVVNPCLKYLNYLIINEIEAGMLTDINARNADDSLNQNNLELIGRKLIDSGVNEKVIIHAPEGGIIVNNDYSSTFIKSLKLPSGYIVGSTGAGDAFCAGALYGLSKNMNDSDILMLACSAAACNLSSADSISGARSYDETMKLYQKYGGLK